jgi:hypothetical protein
VHAQLYIDAVGLLLQNSPQYPVLGSLTYCQDLYKITVLSLASFTKLHLSGGTPTNQHRQYEDTGYNIWFHSRYVVRDHTDCPNCCDWCGRSFHFLLNGTEHPELELALIFQELAANEEYTPFLRLLLGKVIKAISMCFLTREILVIMIPFRWHQAGFCGL